MADVTPRATPLADLFAVMPFHPLQQALLEQEKASQPEPPAVQADHEEEERAEAQENGETAQESGETAAEDEQARNDAAEVNEEE